MRNSIDFTRSIFQDIKEKKALYVVGRCFVQIIKSHKNKKKCKKPGYWIYNLVYTMFIHFVRYDVAWKWIGVFYFMGYSIDCSRSYINIYYWKHLPFYAINNIFEWQYSYEIIGRTPSSWYWSLIWIHQE